MNRCPCCSETLLRHARHGEVYWFCTHCWQEMPAFDQLQTHHIGSLQKVGSLREALSLTSS